MVSTPTHIGYFPDGLKKVWHIKPQKEYKHIKPVTETRLCSKCYAPMQLIVRQKGDIETGKGRVVGYTCNRAGTGCQNAKAKKHINKQKVKAWLNRTPNPKVKKVEGVRLEDSMIRA
jgi:hypothetical protein